MIRDLVTPTELDLLIYLGEPRTVDEIAKFLYVARESVFIRLTRMCKKGLIYNPNPRSKIYTQYQLGKKGVELLGNLRDQLERLKL